MKVIENMVYYYTLKNCPDCEDMLEIFLSFCELNKISSKVEHSSTLRLAAPAIKWGEEWYIGNDAFDKFKKCWNSVKHKAT